jgi:hypothetical protein
MFNHLLLWMTCIRSIYTTVLASWRRTRPWPIIVIVRFAEYMYNVQYKYLLQVLPCVQERVPQTTGYQVPGFRTSTSATLVAQVTVEVRSVKRPTSTTLRFVRHEHDPSGYALVLPVLVVLGTGRVFLLATCTVPCASASIHTVCTLWTSSSTGTEQKRIQHTVQAFGGPVVVERVINQSVVNYESSPTKRNCFQQRENNERGKEREKIVYYILLYTRRTTYS